MTDTRDGAPQPATRLLDALLSLRALLADVRLPLEVTGVDEARSLARSLTAQLDDYVLPRLRRLDAPLLVVVGGSTGAGKSTLVNSIVGADVSRSGVLRPTTRAPVLVYNPADADWFSDRRLLPGMARVTGEARDTGQTGVSADPRGNADARVTAAAAEARPGDALQLAGHDAVPRGLALLDAPDVDSVVVANRALAAQLLAAADLWLFLTTAARYADAVPWDLLREASARSATVAIVLDRVPAEAVEEVASHLAEMLEVEGLGGSPLFVVPEVVLAAGRLPEDVVRPVRTWLQTLASDADARADVARATLTGVLGSYAVRLPPLVDALDEQEATDRRLRETARHAYVGAAAAIDDAVRDGSLLRGEVLARWQDVVGTGELFRGLQARVGQLRDRLVAAVSGRARPADELTSALETGVEALVHAEADRAAEEVVASWRADPAGRALLEAAPDGLDRASADFSERVARSVRDWQGAVLSLVREQGALKRRTSQALAYGVNGVGLLVIVTVFASTGGLTGSELIVAGGTSAVSQKLLEAVLGDQAVRSLAAQAREDLVRRVDQLLSDERDRFEWLLELREERDAASESPDGGEPSPLTTSAALRDAGDEVARALRAMR